jgi:Ca2+-transporting ATPase
VNLQEAHKSHQQDGTQATQNLRQRAISQKFPEILAALSVEQDEGLSSAEQQRRLRRYGPNRLQESRQRGTWQIFLDQFKSPIIALLAIAAVLSFIFQQWIEGFAILVAIVLNTAIGFFTEVKAVQSMQALQKLSKVNARVRRDGQVQTIAAEQLVPGDIVLFEGGDLVPADLRLLEVSKLQVDESPLTGESLPVSKTTDPLEPDLPLAEQKNLLFKGTAITRGSGEGVVIATGMDTELGRISAMTAAAEEEVTPLEKRLNQLGQRLIWVTLAIAALVAVAGIIGGRDLLLMVETAIALSVAAVPEGLPIVATVALARGMWRMAKRNALINKLSAVETLGATNIICTDKTGTLTENRMTVTHLALASGLVNISGEGLELVGQFTRQGEELQPNQDELLRRSLEVSVLCNNASLPNTNVADLEEERENVVGDPMEVALLVAAAKADIWRDRLLEKMPEVREVAFDSDIKMMATIHALDDKTESDRHNDENHKFRFAIKGAPEAVLNVCSRVWTTDGVQTMTDEQRQHWHDQSIQMAEDGLRILALAEKTVADDQEAAYEHLTLLGIVGLLDPPRQEVKEAIAACHQAGIRVIMVTGDQPITARNIGLAVGLVTDQEAEAKMGKVLNKVDQLSREDQAQLQQVSIFARVSPEQKLNLITLHQRNNAIVAMTGDGVNDAPALKKADIGVAMGQRGTQVAQEAAAMVLQDDAFSTIVAAIGQGRAIFRNIRKFTIYLLSGNIGEIMAVGIASLTNAPLPLLPLQILFLNVVNDVFPALALGVGQGNPLLMKQPPRDSQESVLAPRHWGAIVGYGAVIAIAALGVFAFALRVWSVSPEQAVTISFLSLAFGRLWHVFNMRDDGSGLLNNEITRNPYIWGALVLCTGLLLTATYFAPLAQVLQVVDPGLAGWGLIAIASIIPLIVGQTWKVASFWRKQRRKSLS